MTPDQQPAASPLESSPTPARKVDRWRRPLIGPFTVAQVAAVAAAIGLSTLVLVVVTAPLNVAPAATQPRPGSTFFAVGPAGEGMRIGDPAPELMGTGPNGETIGLSDLDGNPIRLADLRGRPVWINFWATWCPPCQEETPVLRDTFEKYRNDGLALVAISVQETTIEDVRAYVQLYGLNYTVGFDATSAIFRTYKAFGLPTHLFLDRDGIIRNIVLGQVTRDQAEEIITALLEPASTP